MYTLLIDEAATLPDPKDRFVIIAAVVTKRAHGLEKIIISARKRIPFKGKRKKERKTSELKFYTAGDKTRKFILQEIAKRKIKIFVLIVDKKGRRIADNPENYGLLVAKLLLKITRKLKRRINLILVDQHFDSAEKRGRFKDIIEKVVGRPLNLFQVDSLEDKRINLADFVAGAPLADVTGKNKEFKEIIKSKIVVELKISWQDIARKKSG